MKNYRVNLGLRLWLYGKPNHCLTGLTILAIFICIFGISSSFAQYYEDDNKASEEGEDAHIYKNDSKEKEAEAENKICPVDFKNITSENKHPYTYKGKIYYFDSLYCIEKFKKDPENYLLIWEKKERFRRINVIND